MTTPSPFIAVTDKAWFDFLRTRADRGYLDEVHTLFDLGYVTVTPDHIIRVSPALSTDWQNGKGYYPYDGKRLTTPKTAGLSPSPDALAWHNDNVFRRAS